MSTRETVREALWIKKQEAAKDIQYSNSNRGDCCQFLSMI